MLRAFLWVSEYQIAEETCNVWEGTSACWHASWKTQTVEGQPQAARSGYRSIGTKSLRPVTE